MQAEAVGWLLRVCEGLGQQGRRGSHKGLECPLEGWGATVPLTPRVAVGKAVFLNEDLWPI